MSFSSDCKEELCRVPPEKSCCRMAELTALYMTAGALSLLGRGLVAVQFTLESAAIARRVFRLMQEALGLSAQVHTVTHARFGGQKQYVLTVGPKAAPALLLALGLMEPDEDGGNRLRAMTPRVRLTRSCCRRAFLRGTMLGCGTVNPPDRGYHLELLTHDDALRDAVARCLQSFGLPIRLTERRDGASVYFKQSDQVTTFLTVVGAHQAVTTIESLRVQRQVLGSVNRALNCDSGNLRKQVRAAEEQTDRIAALIASNRFGALPPALQEIAKARLRAPEVSLEELGRTLDPPLGKSGVNHRMRRLMQYADAPTAGESPDGGSALDADEPPDGVE